MKSATAPTDWLLEHTIQVQTTEAAEVKPQIACEN